MTTPMPDPTPTHPPTPQRVAEARDAVLSCGGINWREDTNAALDALIAAVRADTVAACVEAVKGCEYAFSPGIGEGDIKADILAALARVGTP